MCLLLVAYEAHPRYRLVVAANRDEWYGRAAEPAHAWGDRHGIVAGVDRQGLGTWLGVTAGGRFAALTNYRDGREGKAAAGEPSRGGLVRGFLESADGAEAHLRALAASGGAYRGYNLLAGDGRALAYTSNRGGEARLVEPGIHGLSNHLLDTPWPKVRRGKAALAALLEGGREPEVEALLAMMQDTAVAPDGELPETGVGIELERVLSPLFIRTAAYGTRCTTVLLVARSGVVTFVERTYAPEPRGEVHLQLEVPAAVGEPGPHPK